MSYISHLPEIGSAIANKAVTATLYVSPNGSGSGGKTWATAYTTIQAALDAASVDADECTQIVVGPHATYYDINTTGDPTWAGNYDIIGSHRIWAAVRNEHLTASSVFKFTGKVSIRDMAVFTADSVNGIIFTSNGWRVRSCGFNSSTTSGPNTSVHIDGSAALTRGGIMEDVQFIGNVTHTKAIHIDQSTVNEFNHVNIHTCLCGVHVEDDDSVRNFFFDMDIGGCAVAFDIDDAGGHQHLDNINFHETTLNIDDDTGTNHYSNIEGQFAISTEPDDFTGVAVNTGDGIDTWTAVDVEVRAALTSTKPFRIVGMNLEAGTSEKYRLRLTDGTTYFDDFQFEGVATGVNTQSFSFPGGTEFIFNAGTQIKASSKSESAGVDNLNVWLKIQEI